jgi:hypothetical protein
MVSKGHPLKKYYQLQKQKDQDHVELYDISCTKLSSTQDDHPHFSELKLMSKSRG